ncbi:hypothetical protein ABW20_dc0102917 [Dactylellina cionopaga]|nr:hypothetical protein ABW20_dc0102917 [Dactylellina cionopaga]
MRSELLSRRPRGWWLVCSLLLIQLGIVAGQAPNESSLNVFTDGKCKIKPGPRQVGTPDGFCHMIAQENATSVSIAALGHGCTITIYTDLYCSDHATEIRLNQCLSLGASAPILSFSVDNCTPNPPTSVSTTVRTLTTSSSRPAGTGGSQTTDASDPNSTSSDPNSTSPPSSGLSKGATAGIAVGVTLACLLLIALIVRWFFYSRRPKTPPVAPDHSAEAADMEQERKRFWPFGARRKAPYAAFPQPPSELPASYPEGENGQPQVRAQPVFELSGAQYGELPTSSPTDERPKQGIFETPKEEIPEIRREEGTDMPPKVDITEAPKRE